MNWRKPSEYASFLFKWFFLGKGKVLSLFKMARQGKLFCFNVVMLSILWWWNSIRIIQKITYLLFSPRFQEYFCYSTFLLRCCFRYFSVVYILYMGYSIFLFYEKSRFRSSPQGRILPPRSFLETRLYFVYFVYLEICVNNLAVVWGITILEYFR